MSDAARPKAPIIDVTQLQRPSTVRYQTLIQAVLDADQGLQQGAHPLASSILAVQAVCQFIGSDTPLRVAGVSVVLRRLLAALEDASVGGKPQMLFSGAINEPVEQRKDERKKAGRRAFQTFHTLRGGIVAAVSGLIDAGMKNAEAGKTIERMLAKAGVRRGGKPIGANQILQWREETNATAPVMSDEAAKIIKSMGEHCSPTNSALENAKLRAQAVVTVVARYNSN
jgi:hypothetical protein